MALEVILPVVLGGAAPLSLWMIGSGRVSGWLLGALIQPLWVVWIFQTAAWGLLISVVAFSVVNTRGFIRWVDDEPRGRIRFPWQRKILTTTSGDQMISGVPSAVPAMGTMFAPNQEHTTAIQEHEGL